jgi:hypothetical protein
MNKRSDERGVVSILTVMFFVILLSVMSVAFLRIMSDEQEQVIGDDLTKGALASARSGVEDAKRALLYCRSLPAGPDKTSCEAALNSTTCPGVFGSASSLTTNLGITPANVVQVGGNPELNQRYTCLKVQRDTADVTGIAEENIGDLIELDTNGTGFDTVTLSWHRFGNTYDGAAGLDSRFSAKFGGAASNWNPQTISWMNASSVSYPALLRVQLLEYGSGYNLTTLSQKQLTAYFLPASNGDTTANVGGAIDSLTSGFNRGRYYALCTTTGDYSCSISLTGITIDPAKRYFIRLSTKYRSTNYRVELKSGGALGSRILLRDVQPIIDSTGAADDTYRRVITRIQYGTAGYYTDNALESGDSLCKSFYVTDTTVVGVGTCTGL